MLEITNDNYIPFSMIKKSRDPEKDPDIIVYPDIFTGKISDIMLKKLADLEYKIMKFCISEKSLTSSKKILWFADDPSWTFVYSKNHMIGLQPEKIPLFIRCIHIAVEELTEQKFNSCILTMYENEDDRILSEKEDSDLYGEEALITFGGNSLFHLHNKSNNLLIPATNGSLIIIRENVKKYWDYNIQIEKGVNKIRFNITFGNITQKLLERIPKAKTNCGDKYKPESQTNYSYLPSPLDESITLSDIYLNNNQRYALISQIKKSMAGSIQSDGDQCVNGLKPTLLKQLELKRFLGKGTFANVYAACSPAPCTKDAYKFAIKLTIIPDEEFKYYYSTNKPSWHEPYILKNIINPLVIKGICPNLPLLAESYTCSDCDFKFQDRDAEINKKASCLILLMELGTGGDMSGWLKRDIAPSEDEILISLFQIMAGVHAIQNYGQILNNDIKAQNILSYNIKSGGYWHYIIHGQNFYVPNMGKLFVLNDFGVSRVFNPNHKLSFLLKEKWINLGHRYAMIIDGKYSPFNATNPVDNKLPRVKLIHWEHCDKNAGSKTIEIAKSKGGIAKISVSDKNEIYNPNIQFTSEQLKELKRLGIPADSGNKEFYKHPKVIPPLELIGDTQDVILTFTGGKRATQPGNHASYDSIPQNIKKLLEPYVIKRYVNGGHYIDDDPSKGMAGYFITDFFTRIYDYTQIPIGEKLIATYNIS
jgi:hypothetical protein